MLLKRTEKYFQTKICFASHSNSAEMSLGEPIFLAIQRGYSVETRIVENENEIVCLFVMMMEIGIKKKIEKFSE